MKFFILKKPACVDFNLEPYTEETALKSRHQILSDGVRSNAKLVKLTNGKWYVRYGKAMLEMKDIECKPMRISTLEGQQGTFLDTVSRKWFLQNTRANDL